MPTKILSNQNWNGVFAVQIKPSLNDKTDDCQTIIYRISNNVIEKTNLNSSDISFARSYPCANYIVSMKYYADPKP
mgnify:CR=1 FL=1|jgi:hypothetical protein